MGRWVVVGASKSEEEEGGREDMGVEGRRGGAAGSEEVREEMRDVSIAWDEVVAALV